MNPQDTKVLARILLALGFLAAWVGYTSWYTSRIVFDPGATRAAAHAILTAPPVEHGLADQITKQVDTEPRAAGADPKVAKAVDSALHDPRVTTAFANAIAQVHAALLADKGQKITIDTRTLTSAVHDELAKFDPKLAHELTKHAPISVQLGSTDLPHLGGARDKVETLSIVAILAALLMIGGALALWHERKVFTRLGRRIALLSVGPLIAFVVVPALLDHKGGNIAAVAGAVLRAYRARVLPSALILLGVGVTIVVGSTLVRIALGAGRILTPGADTGATTEPAPGPLGPFAGPNPLHPAPTEPAITEKLYL
jgi:hypothetical protein